MKTLVRFGTIAVLSLTMGAVCFGQRYTQTNLVSNTSGVAPVTDPQLINPLGYPAVPAHPGGSLTTRRASVHFTTARELSSR
jgi:hypothetical protein